MGCRPLTSPSGTPAVHYTQVAEYPHTHTDTHASLLQTLIRAGNVSRSTVVLTNIYRGRLAR
jgi:hypothetical protein